MLKALVSYFFEKKNLFNPSFVREESIPRELCSSVLKHVEQEQFYYGTIFGTVTGSGQFKFTPVFYSLKYLATKKINGSSSEA